MQDNQFKNAVDEQAFNEWFDNRYPGDSLGTVPAMRLAFKEVARFAYIQGMQQSVK